VTSFEILTEWCWADSAPDLLRETAAELTITVGDAVLTRVFDTWSKTVTPRTRVSAYPVAEWLAISWWRLRYEPAPDAGGHFSAAWCAAHDLPAGGRGYVWPRIRFASDGETMQVSAAQGPQAAWEPGRYLTDLSATRIAHDIFDREVDGFLNLVIERLRDTGADARALVSLWTDVAAERAHPEVRAWRELEARLGYFADEGPEALMEEIANLSSQIGEAPTREIAPVIGADDPQQRLKQILEMANSAGIDAKDEQIQLAQWDNLPEMPWNRGRLLATAARKKVGITAGPLSDKIICDILGMRQTDFDTTLTTRSLLGLGVRNGAGRMTLHFRRRNLPGRRFEAARFIADRLLAPEADTWLPQTDASTARQQVQRSFAAEFLMPIADLQNFLKDNLTNDSFEDAGEYFGVSPLAVKSHLVNHRIIPSDTIKVL
jgi:hypothetical protein